MLCSPADRRHDADNFGSVAEKLPAFGCIWATAVRMRSGTVALGYDAALTSPDVAKPFISLSRSLAEVGDGGVHDGKGS
jgi:hypothetical protein